MSEDDVTTALNGVIGSCPRSIATATMDVPTSNSPNLKADWNDDLMKTGVPRGDEESKTEPSILLQLLSAPCSDCVPASNSSSNASSSSSLSSLTSEGRLRKSSSQSSITLSQQSSPPCHSPKAAGLKKRRRHKYIPIQYHYIISPTAETVQPPLKQEQAMKAILDECQTVVECVPNYQTSYASTCTADGFSCWESSPSDSQSSTSWREPDSAGLLDCMGGTTAPSPFSEQNYSSHLYTFPTTTTSSTEYTMFGDHDSARLGMMSCCQMEGEFPPLSQYCSAPSHYEQMPPSYSTAYGTCGSSGIQPTDYLYQGMDF